MIKSLMGNNSPLGWRKNPQQKWIPDTQKRGSWTTWHWHIHVFFLANFPEHAANFFNHLLSWSLQERAHNKTSARTNACTHVHCVHTSNNSSLLFSHSESTAKHYSIGYVNAMGQSNFFQKQIIFAAVGFLCCSDVGLCCYLWLSMRVRACIK